MALRAEIPCRNERRVSLRPLFLSDRYPITWSYVNFSHSSGYGWITAPDWNRCLRHWRVSSPIATVRACSVLSALGLSCWDNFSSPRLPAALLYLESCSLLRSPGLDCRFSTRQIRAQSLGAVPRDKLGAASGMSVTTGRIGVSCGVALSTAVFTYALTLAGLTRSQIEFPENWGLFPDAFMRAFNHTVHVINSFTLLSIVFSASRGGRKD